MSKLHSTHFQQKNRLDNIAGYLFLAPALIAFLAFIGIPVIVAAVLMFYDYNLITTPEFVGMEHLQKLSKDVLIGQCFVNTLKFLVILVPVHVVLGLILAYFTYKVDQFKAFYRSAIYFPVVVTTASCAIAFAYMFGTSNGMINYFVEQAGGTAIPWLTDAKWAYLTIAIFSFWKFIGTSFLYYFIGLQNIPDVYYEAAEIDGAGPVRVFMKITVPLLTPTIFFVLITNIIAVFQIFDEPYFLTAGGPGTATRTVSFQIYQTAFKQMNIGYGATMAFALFVIVLIITVIQFIGQKRWVTYDYE